MRTGLPAGVPAGRACGRSPEILPQGRAEDAAVGDERGDEAGRRDVEGGVAGPGPGRGHALAAKGQDLRGGTGCRHRRRCLNPPWKRTAREYVPILLAASPLAAMRSGGEAGKESGTLRKLALVEDIETAAAHQRFRRPRCRELWERPPAVGNNGPPRHRRSGGEPAGGRGTEFKGSSPSCLRALPRFGPKSRRFSPCPFGRGRF